MDLDHVARSLPSLKKVRVRQTGGWLFCKLVVPAGWEEVDITGNCITVHYLTEVQFKDIASVRKFHCFHSFGSFPASGNMESLKVARVRGGLDLAKYPKLRELSTAGDTKLVNTVTHASLERVEFRFELDEYEEADLLFVKYCRQFKDTVVKRFVSYQGPRDVSAIEIGPAGAVKTGGEMVFSLPPGCTRLTTNSIPPEPMGGVEELHFLVLEGVANLCDLMWLPSLKRAKVHAREVEARGMYYL